MNGTDAASTSHCVNPSQFCAFCGGSMEAEDAHAAPPAPPLTASRREPACTPAQHMGVESSLFVNGMPGEWVTAPRSLRDGEGM